MSFHLHDPPAREESGHERKGDIDTDRKEERLPWHRHFIHIQQPTPEDAVEQEHRERIDRDHDEGQSLVSAGEVSPDQDHRGAGRDPEENRPGNVGAVKFDFFAAFDDLRAGKEVLKKDSEEQRCNRQHRERLDRPVHDQGEDHGLRIATRLDHFAEVDFHHDRIHHEEKADRDRNGNDRSVIHVDRDPVEGFGQVRSEFPEGDPGDNANRDPRGEVALKKAHRRFVEAHEERKPPGLVASRNLGKTRGVRASS